MPGWFEIGLGFLLPVLLCALLIAIANARQERGRSAILGFAFGVPSTLAFVGFYRRFPAWPASGRTPPASDWLAWLVLLASLSSLLYLSSVRPRVLANFLRPGLSAALVLLTLARWAGRSGAWMTLAACFLALLLVWTAADTWIARARGPRPPLALAAAAMSVSLASLFGRSALLGALAGTIAACLVTSAILAVLRPGFRLPASATAVIVLVLAGVLIQGCVFSRVPWSSALLAAVSLLAPGLLELRRRDSVESWKLTFLALALALVPGALAAWIAWQPDAGGSELY